MYLVARLQTFPDNSTLEKRCGCVCVCMFMCIRERTEKEIKKKKKMMAFVGEKLKVVVPAMPKKSLSLTWNISVTVWCCYKWPNFTTLSYSFYFNFFAFLIPFLILGLSLIRPCFLLEVFIENRLVGLFTGRRTLIRWRFSKSFTL